MNLSITYAEAMADYSKEAQEAIDKLKKSRSKHRKTDPKDLQWHYSWGVQIQAYSCAQSMDGTAQSASQHRSTMTLSDKIKDEAGRTRVHIGVAGCYFSSELPTIPNKIMRRIVEGQTEHARGQAKADAMTDEERTAHINELLNGLENTGAIAVLRGFLSP